MPRLSRAQHDARRAIISLEHSSLTVEQLGHRLMQAIGTAIPFDGYRLFGTDPAILLVNRLIVASDNDTWARAEWLREVYLRSDLPYVELPSLMRMGLTAVAFQEALEMCWGYAPDVFGNLTPRQHYDDFHQMRSPEGGTLLANFSAQGKWIASLQLYRRDPDRPFRRGDVSFIRLIAPAVGRAIAASTASERKSQLRGNPVPDVSGVIVTNQYGDVRFSNQAGEYWQEMLLDAVDGNDHNLATPVASAAAALHSSGRSSVAMNASTRSGPVRIEASAASSGNDVTLVISPDLAPARPQIPETWPLTPQERQVVTLLLAGHSNAQISSALTISPNTVQTHLRHTYEKLNVRNRTQVLAALFRESYEPGLVDRVSTSN